MTGHAALRKAVQVQALVLLCLAPAFLLFALGRSSAGGAWILPCFAGLLAAIAAPRRIVVACGAGLLIAGTLVPAASHRPWLAALVMFAVAGGIGLTARLGISGTMATVSITMAFTVAQPPDLGTGIGAAGAAVLTGAMLCAAFAWSAALTTVATRRLHLHPKEHVSLGRSVGFAAVLGIEVGIGAWFVADYQLGHAGAWIMLTTIVILQPTLGQSWRKGLHRALGTVCGVLIALAISYALPWTWVLVLLAIGSIYLAVMLLAVWHAPYWRYVTALTVAIVLLEGLGTSIEDTAINRLWATLVGAAGALLTIAAIYPLLRRYQARHPVVPAPSSDAAA